MTGTQPSLRLSTSTLPATTLAVGALLVWTGFTLVLLWFHDARHLDLGAMSDLGLVSVMPVRMVLAPVVMAVLLPVGLRSKAPPVVLAVLTILLVVMLFGVTIAAEPVPGHRVAWRHLGVVDSLDRTGAIDTDIDAYFSWPGTFALLAFLSSAADIGGGRSWIAWAPLAYNLLALPLLLLLYRRLTADRDVVWLAVWVYYLANWVTQDYLSPQATVFVLMLLLWVLLLTWFPAGPLPQPPPASPVAMRRMVVVLGLFAVIAVSHQLTPYAIVASVVALRAVHRLRTRGLATVLLAILAVWVLYGADAYLRGRLPTMLDQIGQVSSLVATHGERFGGSIEHRLVVRVRSLISLGMWLLAAAGLIRTRTVDRRAAAALLVPPFVLLSLQTYGGEMALRVFLYSLPAAALLVGAAASPNDLARHPRMPPHLAATAVLVALALAFPLARYGNERAEHYTPAEVEAIDLLYDAAPAGSILVAATSNLPWRHREYEQHDHVVLADTARQPAAALAALRALARGQDGPSFVILTRGQRDYAAATGALPLETYDAIETWLRAEPAVHTLLRSPDAAVFRIDEPAGR